jgi:hypothetical protein
MYDHDQFKVTDYWQTPSQYFATNTGDCEDVHLFLADAIYRALGWESYLLIGWKWERFLKPIAHGMTIFKRDGKILYYQLLGHYSNESSSGFRSFENVLVMIILVVFLKCPMERKFKWLVKTWKKEFYKNTGMLNEMKQH